MREPTSLKTQPITDLMKELKDYGEETFRFDHSHPFLFLMHCPDFEPHDLEVDTLAGEPIKPSLSRRELLKGQVVVLEKRDPQEFRKELTVGRSSRNDIVIRSPRISKVHAKFLLAEEDGYRLEDLGSTNGTVLNGLPQKPNKPAALNNGDVVSFWRYTFEYMELGFVLSLLTPRQR